MHQDQARDLRERKVVDTYIKFKCEGQEIINIVIYIFILRIFSCAFKKSKSSLTEQDAIYMRNEIPQISRHSLST